MSVCNRVAEVVRRHKGPSMKSLITNEKFKPQRTLFCRYVEICCDLRSFLISLDKRSVFFFGKKQCFLFHVHLHMVYIAYYTEFNFQTCNYALKRRICRENSNYALDENFYGHFCPHRKDANFCHTGL